MKTKYALTAAIMLSLFGLVTAQMADVSLNMTIVPQNQAVLNYTMPSGKVVYYGYANSTAQMSQVPLTNQMQVFSVPLNATILIGPLGANSYYVMPSGTPVFYDIP
jgi:hypothetical protein